MGGPVGRAGRWSGGTGVVVGRLAGGWGRTSCAVRRWQIGCWRFLLRCNAVRAQLSGYRPSASSQAIFAALSFLRLPVGLQVLPCGSWFAARTGRVPGHRGQGAGLRRWCAPGPGGSAWRGAAGRPCVGGCGATGWQPGCRRGRGEGHPLPEPRRGLQPRPALRKDDVRRAAVPARRRRRDPRLDARAWRVRARRSRRAERHLPAQGGSATVRSVRTLGRFRLPFSIEGSG